MLEPDYQQHYEHYNAVGPASLLEKRIGVRPVLAGLGRYALVV